MQQYSENFDSAGTTWPQVVNADDLIITQGGEYLIVRKNKKNHTIIIASIQHEFSSFELQTNVKFEKSSNHSQSVGVVFMAQRDGSGALILEINEKQEYRLRKITNNSFKIISGTLDNEGWVKLKSISPTDYNKVKIRSHEKVYDIFINNNYVRSFTDLELKQGKIGFFVGPNSKVKVDHISVSGTEPLEKKETPKQKEEDASSVSLTDIIIQLKNQVNEQKKENALLSKKLENCQKITGTDSTGKAKQIQLAKEIRDLTAENTRLKGHNDTLENQNNQLKQFKQQVKKNENGDIIINLTTVISNEKDKNQSLQEKIAALEAERKKLLNELKEAKTGKPESAN